MKLLKIKSECYLDHNNLLELSKIMENQEKNITSKSPTDTATYQAGLRSKRPLPLDRTAGRSDGKTRAAKLDNRICGLYVLHG